MSEINWKKEICTIPNFLSLFRILLIPVYLKLYLNAKTDRDFFLAGSVLAFSCLTDLADGMIAREFHMVSHVGKVLDPLADKLTQLFLMLSLGSRYTILYPMTALFVVKELFQLTAMIRFAQRGKSLSGALGAGKLCTTTLFVSLTLLVLFPGLTSRAVEMLVIIDCTLLFYAFYNYIQAYFGKNTKLTDL